MTARDPADGWKPGDVNRAAEADVFRAFVLAGKDELTRLEILDVLGLGLYAPAQDRGIRRIDRALKVLVDTKRLVKLRTGVYGIIRREAAA